MSKNERTPAWVIAFGIVGAVLVVVVVVVHLAGGGLHMHQ